MPIYHIKVDLATKSSQHLSPDLLQDMAGIPILYPKLLQPRGWATLLQTALPYIIQSFWLCGPF